jgi:hypothetical protein
MKKILMWGIMAISMAGCMKQPVTSAAVPDQVVASFNQRYPYATDVHWGVDNKGLYEAKFKDSNAIQKDVSFRSDGSLMEVK